MGRSPSRLRRGDALRAGSSTATNRRQFETVPRNADQVNVILGPRYPVLANRDEFIASCRSRIDNVSERAVPRVDEIVTSYAGLGERRGRCAIGLSTQLDQLYSGLGAHQKYHIFTSGQVVLAHPCDCWGECRPEEAGPGRQTQRPDEQSDSAAPARAEQQTHQTDQQADQANRDKQEQRAGQQEARRTSDRGNHHHSQADGSDKRSLVAALSSVGCGTSVH